MDEEATQAGAATSDVLAELAGAVPAEAQDEYNRKADARDAPLTEAPDVGIPTQDEYDRDLLRSQLAGLRAEMAKARYAYAAARAQVPGSSHPTQALEEIGKLRQLLDLTAHLLADGLPEPVQGKVIELPKGKVIALPNDSA